ncbi:hypothetical protein IAQ61_008928 [Plenodomus lingam]|uniref:Predicted protein n=1 Tax=Leptosphaeria maculans (strain JN3 / isolate v23.1.3 / race Av1-4-5-6-7-8) TaxID=985895 RepID=E4ZPH8_LEPMJ|nr:predicted protein [Plenodomus lingam JN3]KAH9864982.1 hypothetical protein IAQ61_008928 [Plenodomus lingam]CBX93203.1 predicted protein [Plenodomus lingam JN3]
MFTSTLLTLLLSTAALAIPSPPNTPHTAAAVAPFYSAQGYSPYVSTLTVTSFTTIYTPAAALTSAEANDTLTSSSPASSFSATLTVDMTSTATTTMTAVLEASTTTVLDTMTIGTGTVSATGTESSMPTPSRLAGIYICSDINWEGSCIHYSTPLGGSPSSCTTLDGKASSVGPDMGFNCIFYANAYCDALFADGRDVLSLSYPGNADLRTTSKGDWNDKVWSYQCFEGAD